MAHGNAYFLSHGLLPPIAMHLACKLPSMEFGIENLLCENQGGNYFGRTGRAIAKGRLNPRYYFRLSFILLKVHTENAH